MKKKTQNNNIGRRILINAGIIFLFLIMILGVLGFLKTTFDYDTISGDKFTILKENCWNETYQIGYFCGFFYKFNNLNDTMTINFTLKPEPLNKYSLLKAQEECRRIEQEAYLNSMSLEYPETLKTWVNPFYETKQICEKKEVEEIKTDKWERIKTENCGDIECSNECVFAGDNKQTNPFKNPETREECKIISQEFSYKEAILKKDITKDFIYKNCGCINFSCSSDCETIYLSPDIFECRKNIKKVSEGIEYTLCQKECQEYKCFENYYVEVKWKTSMK